MEGGRQEGRDGVRREGGRKEGSELERGRAKEGRTLTHQFSCECLQCIGFRWRKPQFWANYSATVCPMLSDRCHGQTIGRIKMKLGMQVDLGHDHIMLDGKTAPLPQRGTAPNFRHISVAAKWLHGSRCHFVRR